MMLLLVTMKRVMRDGALEALATTQKTAVVEHVFGRRIERPVVALACRKAAHSLYKTVERHSVEHIPPPRPLMSLYCY